MSLASVRAGNVIGGGDWAKARLIPDCIRALSEGKEIKIRDPRAVRPWQHVLEPLRGYLSLAENMFKNDSRISGPNCSGCQHILFGFFTIELAANIVRHSHPAENH